MSKGRKIIVAPNSALFEVRSNVNDELRHNIDLSVMEEAMTISDRNGNEIVVMASEVQKLTEVLISAERLVSLSIENNEIENLINEH